MDIQDVQDQFYPNNALVPKYGSIKEEDDFF